MFNLIRHQRLPADSPVSIDQAKVHVVAKQLANTPIPSWTNHHVTVADVGIRQALIFCFVVDALNFCFWPSEGSIEYADMTRVIAGALRNNELADLQEITEPQIDAWLVIYGGFPVGTSWPLGSAIRVRALQELGAAFAAHGEPEAWLQACNDSALELLNMIIARLPMFQDETALFHNGSNQRYCFYKRAQILVADIWGCLDQKVFSKDIDQVTTFADYRVPQLLRDMGVLCYSAQLEEIVDSKQEIPANTLNEIAIRVGTILAVERLREAMGTPVTSIEVDWLLWNQGEAQRHTLKPHHRTATWFY
jgi:hypothetical protein